MTLSDGRLIDAVDDHDCVVGVVRKADALRSGANFRVVHTFLFDKVGQLWLQQLPASHARHPLRWGSSVAGYVMTGEAYTEAAERRLRQELGIQGTDLHQYLSTSMIDDRSKKFIVLYLGLWEGHFPSIDRSHIKTMEAVMPGRIGEMCASGERRFTPTFLHLFDIYQRKRGVAT